MTNISSFPSLSARNMHTYRVSQKLQPIYLKRQLRQKSFIFTLYIIFTTLFIYSSRVPCVLLPAVAPTKKIM